MGLHGRVAFPCSLLKRDKNLPRKKWICFITQLLQIQGSFDMNSLHGCFSFSEGFKTRKPFFAKLFYKTNILQWPYLWRLHQYRLVSNETQIFWVKTFFFYKRKWSDCFCPPASALYMQCVQKSQPVSASPTGMGQFLKTLRLAQVQDRGPDLLQFDILIRF